ncbi:hypothetical protein AG4045_000066 [Apium graveolens]|uniref:Deoxynucleoside kinase domain-containing protein n=1 Tax=Apium graveolens TaxID=4045 RepID=A0A6L5B9J3_APIGR|nr:hypothetical protein AG4045_000066 [Apium graveolens]
MKSGVCIFQGADSIINPRTSLDVKPSQKKRLTFCVEWDISVGKSTFLQKIANETLELQDLVEIVPKSVNKWKYVGPDYFNIFDAFYAEPERASPDTCHKRMLLRKRPEEGGVSIDYLRSLHEKLESWLFPSESGNHGVSSIMDSKIGKGTSWHTLVTK